MKYLNIREMILRVLLIGASIIGFFQFHHIAVVEVYAQQRLPIENEVPLGLSTHSLGVKGFPTKTLIEVLSVVRTVATTQLWDFPDRRTQLDNVRNTLATLVANGHKVYHVIYIFNGPGARKGDEVFYKNHLRNRSTASIRKAFLTDQKFKDAVTNYFATIVAFAKELEDLGVFVSICPELEDNQSNQSFKVMLHLLKLAGWTDELGALRYKQVVRNAAGTPSVIREVHASNQVGSLRKGDIFNNDGLALSFTNDSGYISPSNMLQILKTCQKKKVISYIWLEAPQGYLKYQVIDGIFSRTYNGTRSKRKYLIDHKNNLKQMLVKAAKVSVKK